MKRIWLSVKEIAQKLGGECAIDSGCLLAKRDSRLSHQQNAVLRTWNEFSGFFWQKVVSDRATMQRAIGGASRRRAQQIAPVW